MDYIFSTVLSLNEVVNSEPPFNYFKEILGYYFGFHLVLFFLIIVSIAFIFLVYKYKSDGFKGLFVVSCVITLMYSFLYFTFPSRETRLSNEWTYWEKSYVEPFIENRPTETTTNINKMEIEKAFLGNSYYAEIAFSVDNKLITKSNVEIVPKGDEYIVSYKYLEDNLAGYEKGYYDVELIVPEDIQLD